MEKRYVDVNLLKKIIAKESDENIKDGYSLVGLTPHMGSMYFVFEKEHPVWEIIKPVGTYAKESAENIENIYNFIARTTEEIGVSNIKSLYNYLEGDTEETLAILKSFANK